MKVAVTGANGKVTQALIGQLDPARFEITPLDLPEHDATDLDDLTKATAGHDALIHMAWEGLPDVDSIYPNNAKMYENAYRAAKANKIGLVIMGSSNHARSHDQREKDGRVRYTGRPEKPNNPYGKDKQNMESLGQHFARKYALSVLCVRIGNINPEDAPKPVKPSRWMSHRDWGQLVTKALTHDFQLGHFEVMYGVSQQPTFDWVNSFDYKPQDSSE